MLNLALISDSELLLKTKACVADERRAMTEVLWHLREIESRRLFAARGFSSLYDYATTELGYSESAACRRIGAMRLLHSLPPQKKVQIEEALSQGRVSLSTLSSVQRFCRSEKVDMTDKIEIVEKTLGKSQRETDRMLAALSPEPFKIEKTRPLSDTLTELRITLTREQMAKLERAKELLSNRTSSWAELFEVMAEKIIKKSELKNRAPNQAATLKCAALKSPSAPKVNSETVLASAPQVTPARKTSRYIPQPLKRQKLSAANHQCEFVDIEMQRRCSAREHLEIDHIQPLALGGTTEAANLRVLCRAHNQFQAIQIFGIQKIESYGKARSPN